MINLREISKGMWAIIGGIIVLSGVVGGTVGALTYLKSEFAPIALAEEVRLQGVRIEQKIIHDKIDRAKSQMRQIQISCKTNDPLLMTPDGQRHFYQLQQELEVYNRELDQLNQKK